MLAGAAGPGCDRGGDGDRPAGAGERTRADRRASGERDGCGPPDRELEERAEAATAGFRGSPSSSRHSPVAAPPPVPGDEIHIGLQARLRTRSPAALDVVLRRMSAAGLRYTREDFPWWTIEPTPGRFCWGRADRWMAATARRGIAVIAVPDAPPAWATAGWNVPPTTPAARRAYGRFVRQLVGRYGAFGSFWNERPDLPARPITLVDVWNEPYVADYWRARFPDPAAYAAIVREVVRAVRPVDPRVGFMLDADTTALTPSGPQPFLERVLAAEPGLAAQVAAVSVHPYTSDGAPPGACERVGDIDARRLQLCRIEDVRRILDRHGARSVGIWITELGWSTAPASAMGVPPERVARYVHETFALLRGRWAGLVDGLVWYAYDGPEGDPTAYKGFYGLVRRDGSPTPAWEAFASEARRGLPSVPRR